MKNHLKKTLFQTWNCHQKTRLKSMLAALTTAVLAGSHVQAQTYMLSNAWSIATGIGHLDANTGNAANRSIACSIISNQVFVANKTVPAIDAFDGSAGSYLGSLNVTVANSGNFKIGQVAVADDGVIFGANLVSPTVAAGTPFRLYRWANWLDNSPATAYSGDPTGGNSTAGKRMGDNIAIKGAGVNTVILAPLYTSSPAPTTNMALFSTTDGTNFSAVYLAISNLPVLAANGASHGYAFYTNNTFWFKPPGSSAYLVQYPANFASLASPISATVILTNTLSGNNVPISYDPISGLLAAYGPLNNAAPANNALNLYKTGPAGLGSSIATTNVPHTVSNGGNFTGGVALGGAGKTNYIYTVDTDNGVTATAITFTPAAQIPTITTPPSGGSGFPPFTLSVTVIGTAPLAYQWLASNSQTNISSTFTNVPNATTNIYTINSPITNYYEVVITNSVGSMTSTPVLVSLRAPVTSTVVTQLWQVAGGTYTYLPASGDVGRGLGYDTNSQRLVVASTVGGSGLYILDANTGTNIGTLSLTGVSFGGLLGGVDQVVVADDGVVYAGNLVSGSGFTLFSWPAPTNNALGTEVFSDTGSLGGGDRWGDTMAVRGDGLNTQILLGSRNGTNVAFLNNSGGSFTGVYIPITNAPAGFAANGIAFGAGNTLWAKSYLGHLYQIAYDPVNLVGGVLLDYPNPSKIPSTQIGVGIDPVNNILAGIDVADSPNDVKLYQLTGTSDAPVLFDQSFFASANGNGNENVAIAMKYPRLFALDVNNGLVGLTYGTPPTTPPSVGAVASQAVYTNIPAVSFSASVSGSLPLYYQWQFSLTTNDAGFGNLASGTNSTYTLNYPPLNAAGYYRVVVHNLAGYATSTPPALLTLIIPTTSVVVTQSWILPAGSLSFLDSSSYNTRGLAYDTNSGTVLVADNSNIHLLAATNGSYLGDLNPAGAYSGGYNSWLFDQIGVADDGTLYAANLTLTGPNFVILSWAPGYAPGTPGTAFVYGGSGSTATGADPGNGSGDRWGDTMDVRGSGVNTEILIGSYSGTNVVLFTTMDGLNFNANLIAITNVPAGFSGQGIAFGPGNTFFTKSPGYLLRQVAFDPVGLVGGAIQVYTTMPSAFDGIGVDVNAGVLGGVNFSDTPNDLQLYLLSGNTNGPSLFDQAFFGSMNANSQFNAATTLKGGKGFSLDVNNGLTAVTYGTPSAPGVTIISVAYAPGNTVIIWNNTFDNHTYQVQYKNNLLDVTWTNLGSPIPATDATASYTDTTAGGATRFYRVISQ